MQGCRKRGKGGKRRAAAKLLCIVSTPPVRVWPPAALIPGWVGGNCNTTDWGLYTGQRGGGLTSSSSPPPPHPSSVKPVAKCGSRLLFFTPIGWLPSVASKQGLRMQSLVFLTGWEPISGFHFSSFLHILPRKQYNGWISMKSMKRQIIL